jgi:initiation factor 1A
MVYNVGGGNKSKGLARKFVVQSHSSNNSKTVRVVKESGEQYAIVQKHLGNCMCMVFCSDGYSRLCIIRKKFTGRRKTDNNISSGSVVLIGLHDYSSSNENESAKDVKRCDLLYVYSDQEKERLRKLCDLSKLSSSLEDSGPKQKQSTTNANVVAEHESEDIMFVTSGTGVFNKYAKDESRHKGAVIPTTLTAHHHHHHASNTVSKNVISNKDWLDRMNMDMPSDDSDGEEEEEEEEEVDSDEEEEDETPTAAAATVTAATVVGSKKDVKKDVKKDIIDIDDI